MPAEIELLEQFETEHHKDVPEAALPELPVGHTVKPHHSADIVDIGRGGLGFKLEQFVEEGHPATDSKHLNRVVMLLNPFIEFVLGQQFPNMILDFFQELLREMTRKLFFKK